jgi:hypothetical protein
MRRLAQQLTAILSEEQIALLADPEAAERRAQRAARAATNALVGLRRLAADQYPAQRDRLIEAILTRRYRAGTPEYEEARQLLVTSLDLIQGLPEEQFLEHRDQLGAQFARKWGDIPAVVSADRGWGGRRRGPGRGGFFVMGPGGDGPFGTGFSEDPVAAIEGLRELDGREYERRRDGVARAAVGRRMMADRNADFRQLFEEIRAQLDAIHGLPPAEFDAQKAALAQAVFAVEGEEGATTDPGAMALKALERLGDPRMIALLKEKSKYLQVVL